jgi:hypothetical protein
MDNQLRPLTVLQEDGELLYRIYGTITQNAGTIKIEGELLEEGSRSDGELQRENYVLRARCEEMEKCVAEQGNRLRRLEGDSSDSVDDSFEGVINLRRNNLGSYRSWKQYWACLRGTTLELRHPANAGAGEGETREIIVQSVPEWDGQGLFFQYDHAFALKGDDGSIWQIQVSTDEEKSAWLVALGAPPPPPPAVEQNEQKQERRSANRKSITDGGSGGIIENTNLQAILDRKLESKQISQAEYDQITSNCKRAETEFQLYDDLIPRHQGQSRAQSATLQTHDTGAPPLPPARSRAQSRSLVELSPPISSAGSIILPAQHAQHSQHSQHSQHPQHSQHSRTISNTSSTSSNSNIVLTDPAPGARRPRVHSTTRSRAGSDNWSFDSVSSFGDGSFGNGSSGALVLPTRQRQDSGRKGARMAAESIVGRSNSENLLLEMLPEHVMRELKTNTMARRKSMRDIRDTQQQQQQQQQAKLPVRRGSGSRAAATIEAGVMAPQVLY